MATAYNAIARALGFSVGATGNLAVGAPFGVTGELGRGYYFEPGKLSGYTSSAGGPGFMPLFPTAPGSAGFGIQACMTWDPEMFWGDGRAAGLNASLCGGDLLMTPSHVPYGFCLSVGPSAGSDFHYLISDTKPW
jgi:hypothetical protein